MPSFKTDNSGDLEKEVLKKLVFRGALETRPMRIERLIREIDAKESAAIRKVVRSLAEDQNTPVGMMGSGPHANVYLTDYEAAKAYLDRL